MTYIFKQKTPDRGDWYATGEEIRVRWVEKTRTKSNEVERIGWDHSQIKEGPGKQASGNGVRISSMVRVAYSAAGLKSAVRRVRPEEAARIAGIDADIERLQDEILQLRKVRATTVKEAWTKAHVVRLNEVEPTEAY